MLPFLPLHQGIEKLVKRNIKNYPPHIDLDRKSVRQFTFETTHYLQVWSVITMIPVTVTILYTSLCVCEVYTGCMDMHHIYSIVHI